MLAQSMRCRGALRPILGIWRPLGNAQPTSPLSRSQRWLSTQDNGILVPPMINRSISSIPALSMSSTTRSIYAFSTDVGSTPAGGDAPLLATTTDAFDQVPITPEDFEAIMKPLNVMHFPIAVAVSGGPDSAALSFLLQRWAQARGYSDAVHAVIVDHGLRPESAQEAIQVQTRLEEQGFHAHVLKIDWKGELPNKNKLMKQSRDKRREVIHEFCQDRGIATVFLGHHLEDNIETFCYRLDHGSGLDGLAAMERVSRAEGHSHTTGITLVRPLLDVGKSRLIATCEANGLEYVQDPTNDDQYFLRARIRAGMDALVTASPKHCQLRHEIGSVISILRRASRAYTDIGTSFMERNVIAMPELGACIVNMDLLHSVGPFLGVRIMSRLAQFIGGTAYPASHPVLLGAYQEILTRLRRNRSLCFGRTHWGPVDGPVLEIIKRHPSGRMWQSLQKYQIAVVTGEASSHKVRLQVGETLVWENRFKITARVPELLGTEDGNAGSTQEGEGEGEREGGRGAVDEAMSSMEPNHRQNDSSSPSIPTFTVGPLSAKNWQLGCDRNRGLSFLRHKLEVPVSCLYSLPAIYGVNGELVGIPHLGWSSNDIVFAAEFISDPRHIPASVPGMLSESVVFETGREEALRTRPGKLGRSMARRSRRENRRQPHLSNRGRAGRHASRRGRDDGGDDPLFPPMPRRRYQQPQHSTHWEETGDSKRGYRGQSDRARDRDQRQGRQGFFRPQQHERQRSHRPRRNHDEVRRQARSTHSHHVHDDGDDDF